jgi:hypothetical protein
MLLWHGGQVGARFRRARLPGVNSPSPLTIPGSIEKLDRPIQPVRQSSSRVLGSEVAISGKSSAGTAGRRVSTT